MEFVFDFFYSPQIIKKKCNPKRRLLSEENRVSILPFAKLFDVKRTRHVS